MSDTITLFTADELAAMAERERAATPGPWWQKSHRTPTAPHPDARELSSLLCYFPDEGEPRVWCWDTDGEFIVHARNEYARLLAVAQWAGEAAKLLSAIPEGWEDGNWMAFLGICNEYGVDEDLAPRDAIVEVCRALLARLTPPEKP